MPTTSSIRVSPQTRDKLSQLAAQLANANEQTQGRYLSHPIHGVTHEVVIRRLIEVYEGWKARVRRAQRKKTARNPATPSPAEVANLGCDPWGG